MGRGEPLQGGKCHSSGKGLVLKSSQKVEESAENNPLQNKSTSPPQVRGIKPPGSLELWDGLRGMAQVLWKPEAAAETNVLLQLCWLASYQLHINYSHLRGGSPNRGNAFFSRGA